MHIIGRGLFDVWRPVVHVPYETRVLGLVHRFSGEDLHPDKHLATQSCLVLSQEPSETVAVLRPKECEEASVTAKVSHFPQL